MSSPQFTNNINNFILILLLWDLGIFVHNSVCMFVPVAVGEKDVNSMNSVLSIKSIVNVRSNLFIKATRRQLSDSCDWQTGIHC